MIYTFLGFENVDYVSKKTNKRVIGLNIFVCSPIDKNGEGQKTTSFYLSNSNGSFDYLKQIGIGSEIEIYFNQYGQVVRIIEV